MTLLIDLTGKKFHYWTVIERDMTPNLTRVRWMAQCKCGTIKSIKGDKLVGDYTKSCGCRENKANSIHRLSYTRIYKILSQMKSRCYRLSNPAYLRYGGRGIKVCDEWFDNVESFYRWSIENGYSEDLTIDRIDNNKGYSPDNCRWADKKTQANNNSRNAKVTYNGQTMNKIQWAEYLGVRPGLMYSRFDKWGEDYERIFNQPIRKSPTRKVGA